MPSLDLDKTLLRFTLAFFLMYSTFTIIKGSFTGGNAIKNDKNEIQILNGVVEIVQVTLQVVFIEHFREKVRKMEWSISDALERNGCSRMIYRFIYGYNGMERLL